jgi:succinate dehydrogenase / fumarate reductase cytochrome b subunit
MMLYVIIYVHPGKKCASRKRLTVVASYAKRCKKGSSHIMDREKVQLVTPVEPRVGERPLSPRLIYHWHIGMAASLLHRLTGVAIFFSIPYGLWFLIRISQGENSFVKAIQLLHHPVAQFSQLVLLFGMIYHLINGIRYIFLDKSLGVDIATARKSAWLTLIFSFILSAGIFFY